MGETVIGEQSGVSSEPHGAEPHAVETKIFPDLDSAKKDCEQQNAKLPETREEGKRVQRGSVFVARSAGREPLYVVAVAAGRARDAAAQHWGVIVELAEPKRKPKPTIVELLAATGAALTPEQIEQMRSILDSYAPPKKRGK